jgi:hypothetical protein
MNVIRAVGLSLIGLAMGAQAQTGSGGVVESTDPARAAAIERAAAALKARPAQPAVGLVRAKTSGGQDLLSGGNTGDDRAAMYAERERYSLWVSAVAKPSGAYLADTELRIVDAKKGTPVLERKMEGPWLFVALPEGRYDVSGSFLADGADKAQTLTSRVNVPGKGQRQVVLRFDSNATVDPDTQGQVKGNPFAGPVSTR